MIISLVKRISSIEAVRHSFILTAGTVLAQCIPLLFMLILSRYYSNASFGVYQLFYQVSIILGVVANGRLEQPVMTTKEDRDADSLFNTATKLSLYVGLALIVLFSLAAVLFPGSKIITGLGGWLWVLPLSIYLNANMQLLGNGLNRKKDYRSMVMAKILLVLFTSIVPAIGILFHWNNSALLLIAGYMVGLLSGVYFSKLKANRQLRLSLRMDATDRDNLKAQKHFIYYSTPAILIDQLAASLPLLFIANWYGNAATGDIGFAQRILIVPSVFIAGSVSQVYFKQASDHFHSGKDLYRLTVRTFIVLLLIGSVPFMTIILWGDQLLPWIFGDQWIHASHLAQVLSWAMILKFAVSPVSMAMVVTNRIKLQASWQLTALILNVALAAWAWRSLDLDRYIFYLTVMDIGLYLMYLLFILFSTKKTRP